MPPTTEPQPADSDPMVLLAFRVPRSWRDALGEAAHSQRISVADLARIIFRGFLRERYTPAERVHLGLD